MASLGNPVVWGSCPRSLRTISGEDLPDSGWADNNSVGIERPVLSVDGYARLWPVSDRRIRRSLTRLHLGLLGDLQCIVDLDSEIPNGAFEFGMAEEKLNGPEISCSPIDQRGFRPAK